MYLRRKLFAVALAAALAACGGGGGNSGSTSSGGGSTAGAGTTTTTTITVPTAASFVAFLDKSSINNGGIDKAVLTITALDASRNVVSGVPVTVSVDSGIYTAVVGTTGATGEASGTITIGGDKTNRSITASIVVGGKTGVATVAVTGSRITLAALPATPAPGASVQVTARAADVNGTGVPGVSVQFGGTLGITQLVTTNASGDAVATLGAAPAVPGTYSVTAAGLGGAASQNVLVVGGGGGGVPPAVGVISTASLQINPNSVFANAAGAIANRANLQATFQDANNQAIQNVRVRFEIVPPGLGSGELISTGTNTVYSDVGGVGLSAYIPGTRTSPTNGVVIRACYGSTDAAIAFPACPNSVTKTMTVGGQAISVALGFNNELAKGNSNLTYIQKFVALVTDSNGNAVSNAVLSASVDITHFGKGWSYADNYYVNGLATPLITAPNTATTGINATDVPTINTLVLPATNGKRVWCKNEDLNRNGFLDVGEDVNGNGKLDSPKADVILSFVGSNTTAADGTLLLQVQYPQNVATWLSFTIKVSVVVAGSEGSVENSFFTGFVKGDETNGSFLTPPFGTGNCSTPN